MAKWRIGFVEGSRPGPLVIEADEVKWPDTAGSTDAAVEFVNCIEPPDGPVRPNVTLVTNYDLVAYVNTRFVASIQRVVEDEKSDADE